MQIVMWIIQGLLALFFLIAGGNKVFNYEKAKEMIPWAKEYSRGFVLFIGVAELLGAIGLILPKALNILPVLTPIAATGLAIIMLAAIIFHIKRQEMKAIGMNIVLLILSSVVALYYFL